MKRKIMAIAVSGVLALGGLSIANPAQAATGTITVSFNSATCKYTASKVSGGVKATNSSCARVRATVQYISAAGQRYWTPSYVSPVAITTTAPSGTSFLSGITSGSIVQGNGEIFRDQAV
jgi:hypothetical protein